MALVEDSDDFEDGFTTGKGGKVEFFNFSFSESFSFTRGASLVSLRNHEKWLLSHLVIMFYPVNTGWLEHVQMGAVLVD